MRIFLIRGLVAITWAVVFAAVSNSLTTGVTVGASCSTACALVPPIPNELTQARRGPSDGHSASAA